MLKFLSINCLTPTKNIRPIDNDASFKQLCDSIKANGLLQPILVREVDENSYEIIAGHRRYEALKSIGEKLVACYISDSIDSEKDILRAQLSENIHRNNMTPIEYVKAFDNLKKEYGLTNNQLALFLNKSVGWVCDQYAAAEILKTKYGDEDNIPEEEYRRSGSTIKARHYNGTKEEKVKKSGNGFNVEIKRHIYKITCCNNTFENELIDFLKKHNMN